MDRLGLCEMNLPDRAIGKLYQIKWYEHKIQNGIIHQWPNAYCMLAVFIYWIYASIEWLHAI